MVWVAYKGRVGRELREQGTVEVRLAFGYAGADEGGGCEHQRAEGVVRHSVKHLREKGSTADTRQQALVKGDLRNDEKQHRVARLVEEPTLPRRKQGSEEVQQHITVNTDQHRVGYLRGERIFFFLELKYKVKGGGG